jgi:hypothetical protein
VVARCRPIIPGREGQGVGGRFGPQSAAKPGAYTDNNPSKLGITPHPLLPHQQRLTVWEQRGLLREVAGNLGAILFLWDTLFDPAYEPYTSSEMMATWGVGPFPTWPDTAAALATSFYGMWCTGWSLTEVSAPVQLWKIPSRS